MSAEGSPRPAGSGQQTAESGHEGLYRFLAESTNDIITLYDVDGHRIYVSPSHVRVLGEIPAESFGGVHPDDMPLAQEAWRRVLAGEKASITYRHAHADGSWRWLEAFASLVTFEGKPHVMAVSRDVTERRRAEEERRAHVWLLEGLDRVNRAMHSAGDLDQMMREVLDVVLSIFACDRAWLGQPCDPDAATWHIAMERTRSAVPGAFTVQSSRPIDGDLGAALRAIAASNHPVRFDWTSDPPLTSVDKDCGVQSRLAVAVQPNIGPAYVFGMDQCSHPRAWLSIEERLFEETGRRLADGLTSLLVARNRREAEDRARESEALFRTFLDHAVNAFFVHDERGTIVDANRHACETLGYTRDELIGMSPLEFDVGVDKQPEFVAELRARLHRGELVTFESLHRRKDGTIFPVEVRIQPFLEGDRKRSVSLVRDITERKRSERALVESHRLLNAVVEGTADVVFVKDLDGRYLMINSAGATMLGRSVEEVIGRRDTDLFPPETARRVVERDREVFASGESQTFEETLTAATGTRTFLATRGVHRDAQGSVVGLVGISSDVTELKQLEEQFRQAQKMEAVGRLAGGVAHDFNNLLTVINSYSEIVYDSLDEDDPNREPLTEIRSAGERAANLTRQLLAFSRKQMLQPRIVDLNALLAELLKLLHRLIGEDIALALVARATPALAEVDPGQFEQAIINLAVNARDAMPHGGRLTIETSNATLDNDYAERHPDVRPGSYLLVAVSDTGHGIDPDTVPRIFEPFFTTKGPGQGTGLGLAMVYGFVKQSGGHIDVESEAGTGATLRIYLPRAAEPEVDGGAAGDLLRIATGTETVLLVEDEDPVRRLCRRILESTGYTVLEAQDGAEAIAVAQDFAGRIDILVTDLVMPHISGRQLADRLAHVRPGIRVLFMSGYTDEAVTRQGLITTGAAFLQKPFSPIDLARKVRQVLDS